MPHSNRCSGIRGIGWGRSSVGRAAGSQSAGQGFESPRLHHPSLVTDARRFRAKDGVLRSLGAGGLYCNEFRAMDGRTSPAILQMFYTYIIKSLSYPEKRYIGHTSDLQQRLFEHNTGRCIHTAKFTPWKLKIYVAFETLEQAQRFERYLKSGSGHAFAGRHFCPLPPEVQRRARLPRRSAWRVGGLRLGKPAK